MFLTPARGNNGRPKFGYKHLCVHNLSTRSIAAARNGSACRRLISMHTIETTDAKIARRCRYDQHRFQKTTLTIKGCLVTGLVRSVMEIKSSNPARWILTISDGSDTAAGLDHLPGNP